jgi:hypothetical protein
MGKVNLNHKEVWANTELINHILSTSSLFRDTEKSKIELYPNKITKYSLLNWMDIKILTVIFL